MPGNLEPLELGVQIPYHFRCPISLELMRDPVTVCTGQTYDRSSIESWVFMGNTTCPVTRSPLTDFNLIPNHTLRRLIQDWCVANRSYGIERIPTPKQPAEPRLVRSLINQACNLNCQFPPHSRLAALRRLRTLARDSEINRSLIASHDATDSLISLLFSDMAFDAPELTQESIALLVMFNLDEPQCSSIASQPSRVTRLSCLLFATSIDVRVNSAALIEGVLTGTRSADLKFQVTSLEAVFEGVLDLLRNPISSYPRALKVGIKCLFALCLVKQTRHLAISAGAAEMLIDKLSDFDRCDTERALATVELLCRVQAGCEAFASHALTVPLLVKTMLRVSERATEYATGALLAICSAEERCRKEAVVAGIITQLLLVVQSECTERAKRKAQTMLKLLRDSWPGESMVDNSEDFSCCNEVTPF